jgi:hypothetical protein
MGNTCTKNPLICKIGGVNVRGLDYEKINNFQDALRVAGEFSCRYEDALVIVVKHNRKVVRAFEKFYLVDKIIFGEKVVQVQKLYGKRR